MLVRPAKTEDYPEIIKLISEIDEAYPGFAPDSFWVAEEVGTIVGTVRLIDYPNFVFLESLAVKNDHQGQGIAQKLITDSLKTIKKDIYLYTIIPDFFKKFGFEPITPTPSFLPGKTRYECQFCQPKKCVTMVRYAV